MRRQSSASSRKTGVLTRLSVKAGKEGDVTKINVQIRRRGNERIERESNSVRRVSREVGVEDSDSGSELVEGLEADILRESD